MAFGQTKDDGVDGVSIYGICIGCMDDKVWSVEAWVRLVNCLEQRRLHGDVYRAMDVGRIGKVALGQTKG